RAESPTRRTKGKSAPLNRRSHPGLLPFHSAPADVAAAEAAGPLDAIDAGIGALTRLGDTRARGRHIEDAAAIGDELAVTKRRTGVEYFHTVLGSIIQAT